MTCVEKLNNKEIYNALITEILSILTSQHYCNNPDWANIYILQRMLSQKTKANVSRWTF